MDTEERQEAILSELQGLRRAVRTILFILALFVVHAVLSAVSPQLGAAMTLFGGIVALVILVGAFVGMGAAKLVSTIRQ